jgi:hypothetical protein
MADLSLEHVFLDQVDQDQANDGKDKIEGQVVLPYELHLERRLYEMGQVLDCHSAKARKKSNQYAQHVDELLIAEVLVPPLEKFLPQLAYL